jgi:ParB-like chromosome segregation protein Spo0J
LHLYRPIDLDDPAIIQLADAIKRNGCVPLVITQDKFIVSGHRRHAALMRLEQEYVRCEVLPVCRDSMSKDDFIRLLHAHNIQRAKNLAEQIREELVNVNPDDAYDRLRKSRDKSVYAAERNGVEILTIEGEKKRSQISDDKAYHVKYIQQGMALPVDCIEVRSKGGAMARRDWVSSRRAWRRVRVF